MSEPKPSPWSDDAAAFVDAFREDVAVDLDVDTAWAQFEDVVRPAPTRRRVPMALWFGAAAALAAAIALVWVVRSATSLRSEASESGQQAPHGAAPEPAGVAPSRPVPPERSASRVTEAVVPEPPEPAPEAAVPRRSVPTPRARGRETPPPESAPLASRLAEELRLLDAMRAASKDGRHADALRRVREHAASFSSGSFAAERELTRVRALCGLGKLQQVRSAQSSFAKSHPASHLASLVGNACPAASKEIRKSDHDG